MVDVTMPQLGETVTEGTIIRWFKQVGDPVEADEILFEISTDKVDSEVPSPTAGVVTEILASEGDVVEVGQVLARVGSPDEAPAPESAPAAEPASEPVPVLESGPGAGPAAEPEPLAPDPGVAAASASGLASAPESVSETSSAEPVSASPPASDPISVSETLDSEPAPAPVPASEPSAPEPTAQAAASGPMAKVLSPVVRRLIAENDLDPDAIVGTGLGGRVTRADVEAVIRARAEAASAAAPSTGTSAAASPAPESPSASVPEFSAEPLAAEAPTAAPEPSAASPLAATSPDAVPQVPEPSPAAASPSAQPSAASSQDAAPPPSAAEPAAAPPPAPASPSRPAAPPSAPAPPVPAPSPRSPAVRPGDRVVKLNNIRRRTAEHMVMSKQTSPHVLTAIEIDYEGVEQVRRSHKAAWKAEEGFSLTYLPFICRAVVDALREYPHLNATFGDGELIVHASVNLAIAVDIDFTGLLAPVVKEADGKRLRQIARDVVDLAARARTKQLGLDDLTGGTFTLTNAGQYGTMMQFPIINQPQVAILSTDGVSRKPVVVTDGFGNESIAIHSVGVLAMAWDHRAFDGAYAAAFLHRVKEIIETRDWEAEVR